MHSKVSTVLQYLSDTTSLKSSEVDKIFSELNIQWDGRKRYSGRRQPCCSQPIYSSILVLIWKIFIKQSCDTLTCHILHHLNPELKSITAKMECPKRWSWVRKSELNTCQFKCRYTSETLGVQFQTTTIMYRNKVRWIFLVSQCR